MRERLKNRKQIKDIVINHITNNIREYAIVTLIFFIGLIIGTIFINNSSYEQENEIGAYINNFVKSMQQNSTINYMALLKKSITSNIIVTLCLWFAGCTVVGMPIVYGTIGFRGFCLGYTISAITATLGTGKGLIFSSSTVLLQNIILIPAMLALSVSGIKLYKSIMKDKRKENIKLEILRHTAFSLITSGAMIFASFVEVYISSNFFINIVKFI